MSDDIWNGIKLILIFLKDSLPVISIFIAVLVFRFNKRMSYSKLSVKPNQRNYDQSMELSTLDYTYDLYKLDWINPKKGLPASFLTQWENEANKSGYKDIRMKAQMLTVTLLNKGELASTNIKITLIFKAYGSKIIYSENPEGDFSIQSSKRKKFTSKKIVIKVPYMGAGEEREFVIVDLRGQFREAELILTNIRANGHSYFRESFPQKLSSKNRVVINKYIHPYLSGASDSDDQNMMLGIHNPDGEWEDPYKEDQLISKTIRFFRTRFKKLKIKNKNDNDNEGGSSE